MSKFKWENDDFWWERLELQDLCIPWTEVCIPESWSAYLPPTPDKLMHAFWTFYLCFWASRLLKSLFKGDITKSRYLGCFIGYFLMMVPWEIIWDGMYRHGASWKDMVANTIGMLLCFWWLNYPKVGQTDGEKL